MTQKIGQVKVKGNQTTKPMSPGELGKLAARLARSKSRIEARKYAAQITQGFYSDRASFPAAHTTRGQ